MINIFQMNAAGSVSGLKLSGNTKTTGDTGNSLFSILLKKINGASENTGKSLGLSLFTDIAPANMTAKGDGADSEVAAINNIVGKKIAKSSILSSDLTLPETAMSQLTSFLEGKGFSTEQTDQIILSSRNDEGLIQINKLVTAINAAKHGNLSADSGLVIEAASIPKVQELLFKAGLGVGEVKETIEKSIDQNGELSLDKLSDALKELSQETFSKSELVSALNQNDISIKSQTSDLNTVVTDLKSQSTPVSLPAQNDIILKPQITDSNTAVADLKKEFVNLIEKPSQSLQKTDEQNFSALLRANGMSESEIKSFMETASADFTSSKAAPQGAVAVQDSDLLSQVLLKDQTQMQKGDKDKIIDVLNNENSSDNKVADKSLFQENADVKQDVNNLLKQGDPKVKQEIITGIAENKTIPKAQATEETDAQGGTLNLKETPAIDFTSQNMTKATTTTGDVGIKSHTPTTYNLPDPLPKVVDRMVLMIKNGEQTGKLIIQPPELGKIDIDLTIRNGHIQANLSTESYAVKEIIETNLNQLKQHLTDQGLIVEQFNVSVGSGNKQFREDNNWARNSSDGSSQSGISDIEDASSMMDEGIASSIMNSQYRVDLHV